MADDLVKQLRFTADDVCRCGTSVCLEAADRIEKLEAALREPTLPMLLAGKKSLYSCSEDPEIEDARACFLAMARKALEGKDE
jgi:hypothetical protein